MALVDSEPLIVAGLFAGIGGFELGLSRSGHKTRKIGNIIPN